MRIKAIFLLFIFSLALFAATKVWDYDRNSDPDGARIIQIVSDGKGGCASVWIDTNDLATIVWLDKKGEVKYEQQVLGMFFSPSLIIHCSKKRLVHFSGVPIPLVVQVDAKGNAKVTGTLNGYLMGVITLPIPSQKIYDKKGFFTANSDTNAIYQTLIRYSHN